MKTYKKGDRIRIVKVLNTKMGLQPETLDYYGDVFEVTNDDVWTIDVKSIIDDEREWNLTKSYYMISDVSENYDLPEELFTI